MVWFRQSAGSVQPSILTGSASCHPAGLAILQALAKLTMGNFMVNIF
jgi:hypothetical protein